MGGQRSEEAVKNSVCDCEQSAEQTKFSNLRKQQNLPQETTSKSANLVTIIEQQQQQRCISLTTNQSFNQLRPTRRTSKYIYSPVLPIHTIFRRTLRPMIVESVIPLSSVNDVLGTFSAARNE